MEARPGPAGRRCPHRCRRRASRVGSIAWQPPVLGAVRGCGGPALAPEGDGTPAGPGPATCYRSHPPAAMTQARPRAVRSAPRTTRGLGPRLAANRPGSLDPGGSLPLCSTNQLVDIPRASFTGGSHEPERLAASDDNGPELLLRRRDLVHSLVVLSFVDPRRSLGLRALPHGLVARDLVELRAGGADADRLLGDARRPADGCSRLGVMARGGPADRRPHAHGGMVGPHPGADGHSAGDVATRLRPPDGDPLASGRAL